MACVVADKEVTKKKQKKTNCSCGSAKETQRKFLLYKVTPESSYDIAVASDLRNIYKNRYLAIETSG